MKNIYTVIDTLQLAIYNVYACLHVRPSLSQKAFAIGL